MFIIIIIILMMIMNYRINESFIVRHESCSNDNQCISWGSICHKIQHKCVCPDKYIPVYDYQHPTTSIKSIQLPYCLRMAILYDRCYSNQQCIIPNSVCAFENPPVGGPGQWGVNSLNHTKHYCQCKPGFHKFKEEQKLRIGDQDVEIDLTCINLMSINGNNTKSLLYPLIIISIVLIVLIITCFVVIVRIQKYKQRQQQQQCYNQQMVSNNTSGLLYSGPTMPPAMGSTEAEFQNDFIQVFPMHHLEPLPDKN